MELFGAKSKFTGQPVSINEGNTSVEERYLRAKCRVESLTGKLRRIDRKLAVKQSSNLLTARDQTKFALEEWTKRLKVAKYELDLYSDSGTGVDE